MTILRNAMAAAVAIAVVALPAAAATVSSNILGEFNYDGPDVGDSPVQTVGAFNFTIPAGDVVTSATLNGTFGNSTVSSTAAVKLFLDSVFVGECIYQAACWQPGIDLFSFSLPDLTILNDGSAVFTIVQTSESFTRLGQSQLVIETSPVPVPAAGYLLLGGFGALGLVRRRKKKAA